MSKIENTFAWGRTKTPEGDLETRVEHLEQKMESAQHDITDIKHKDSELEQEIETIKQDADDLGNQVVTIQNRVTALERNENVKVIEGKKTVRVGSGWSEHEFNWDKPDDFDIETTKYWTFIKSDGNFNGLGERDVWVDGNTLKLKIGVNGGSGEANLNITVKIYYLVNASVNGRNGEIDLSQYVRKDELLRDLCAAPCEWANDLQSQITSNGRRIDNIEHDIETIKEQLEQLPADEPIDYNDSNKHKLRLIANFASENVETLYNYRSGSQHYFAIKIKGWENYLKKLCRPDDPFKNINRCVYDYSVEYHHDGGYNPLGEEDELYTTYDFLVHYGDLIITITKHNTTKDESNLLDGYKEQMLICFYKHGYRLNLDDDPNIGTL